MIQSTSTKATEDIGEAIGRRLNGGEVIELVSDLGGGKTQLVRGLARGIGSRDAVQSPSFTISRIYKGKGLEIHHFDFHRLDDPGLMKHELADVIGEKTIVVAVEWADRVSDVLPADRLIIRLAAIDENEREIDLQATGPKHKHLLEEAS